MLSENIGAKIEELYCNYYPWGKVWQFPERSLRAGHPTSACLPQRRRAARQTWTWRDYLSEIISWSMSSAVKSQANIIWSFNLWYISLNEFSWSNNWCLIKTNLTETKFLIRNFQFISGTHFDCIVFMKLNRKQYLQILNKVNRILFCGSTY